MASQKDQKSSKFMSLVLRHAHAEIGVTPDPQGWVAIDTLIAASDGTLDLPTLERIVANSDKQRFSISSDGLKVRANQGHSIPVDLGLTPQTPLQTLNHGTAQDSLELILAEGLKPMARQHVHLSKDVQTAQAVGMRHGAPVVLNVASGAMHGAGHLFYLSENGVWLTVSVPPQFLSLAS